MNLSEYKPLALRTEKKLPTSADRAVHAILGLLTEGGELNTIIKRVAIYGKSLDELDKEPGPDGTRKNLRQHAGEEIGDAMWYVAIGADLCGMDLGGLRFPEYMPGNLSMLGMVLGVASGRLAEMGAYLLDNDIKDLSEEDKGFLLTHLVGVVQILQHICVTLGLDLDTLLVQNIEKLRVRFPSVYSDEAAEARADKGGLDARNS